METDNTWIYETILGMVSATVSLRLIPSKWLAFFVGYFAYAFILESIVINTVSPDNQVLMITIMARHFGAYLLPYAFAFFLFQRFWNINSK